ncbi:MAG: CvpA family protein [Candidatus Omnitrophica bacterium]|nr:CvpA family protein [Candidatus Omnitrophota bacterium]
MVIDIVRQFNWVDILVLVLAARICYIGIKQGFPAELFKLPGTILAIYLSLHYYTMFSDIARDNMNLRIIPLEFLDLISFVILACLGYLFFIVLREVFARFLKMEAVPKLNKWGGCILSLARAYLLAGLIAYALAISTVGYLKDSVHRSYSGNYLFKVSPTTYSWLWNNIMSKFMSHEKFNKTVNEVQEKF